MGGFRRPPNHWALPFMSPHPLYRIPPRVLGQAEFTYMQQSFTYLLTTSRCVYIAKQMERVSITAYAEEFYIQMGTAKDK